MNSKLNMSITNEFTSLFHVKMHNPLCAPMHTLCFIGTHMYMYCLFMCAELRSRLRTIE